MGYAEEPQPPTGDADRKIFDQAWLITALLTLLYVFSFADRLILVMLAPSISREIGLSDVKMGFLLGVGFAIVYSVSGLPIARWIDRGERLRIVVSGVLLWSLMTMASGFSRGFWSLCVTRAGVAIGETVLTPAAISLIADMFPRERRMAPVSLFSSVGGFMGTGAFVIGAITLDIAALLHPALGLAPWRIALVLIGIPGILLGLSFSRVKEPPRVSSERTSATGPGFGEFVQHLKQHARFYVPLYVGLGASSMISLGTVSWFPTFLVRHFAVTPSQAGYWLGSLGVPAGVLGAFLWPLLARILDRKYPRRGLLVALLLSLVMAVCLLGSVTLVHSMSTLAPIFATGVFSTSATAVLAGLIVQDVGPPRMRARLMALVLLAFNLLGLGLGPSLVPFIARWWAPNTSALAHGISVLALGAGGFSAACFAYCIRVVGRDQRVRSLEDVSPDAVGAANSLGSALQEL